MATDTVEIVLAFAGAQHIVEVAFTPGLTALEAVTRSRLLERFPDAACSPLVLGCFGARIDPGRVLKPGDRIEICRPLRADPREKRKELSRRGQVIGSA